jgi:hypothetical protein
VFVFAKKLPAGVKAPPPPTEPVVIDQQGCKFVPQAMVFRVGQPLLMKNSDPVSHNVRTKGLTTPINQIQGLTRTESGQVRGRSGCHWHVRHPCLDAGLAFSAGSSLCGAA